jgi:hypothetical protein
MTTNKELWVGLGKQFITFIAGVIVAAFILGRNSQKINEMILWKQDVTNRWKTDVAPRIERMDRQGSISFENFYQQYEKEQAKQYVRLGKLEDQVAHLETMKLQIDRLERRIDKDPTKRKRAMIILLAVSILLKTLVTFWSSPSSSLIIWAI